MIPFPSLLAPSAPVCVWDPTTIQGLGTVSTDRLTVTYPTGAGSGALLGTVGRSKSKWYCEVVTGGGGPNTTTGSDFAISPAVNTSSSQNYQFGQAGAGITYASVNGGSLLRCTDLGYSFTNYGAGYLDGILMCAVDLDSHQVWFGLNGSWFGFNVSTGLPVTGDPASGVGGVPIIPTIYFPGFQNATSPAIAASARTAVLQARRSSLTYTPPVGFSPWS